MKTLSCVHCYLVSPTVAKAGCFGHSRGGIPFKQEFLGHGTHFHMKLFVHDLTEFHPGSFDTDAYRIWLRFGTRIQ